MADHATGRHEVVNVSYQVIYDDIIKDHNKRHHNQCHVVDVHREPVTVLEPHQMFTLSGSQKPVQCILFFPIIFLDNYFEFIFN